MKTANNTILVTGGSTGIGLEIARVFSKSNHVIILGRNKERLDAAAAQLTNVTAIAGDVSSEEEVDSLVKRIGTEFPELNVVINNAGLAFLYDLNKDKVNAFDKAANEMLTNYLSVIRLNEKLLPLLKNQKEAAIVNVSSIVAFVPGTVPTYSASKAALHSYTQSLRISLEETSVKVFELMPPLVDTEFSKGIQGHKGVKPSVVAEDLFHAFEEDRYEIRTGNTENIYKLFLSSPDEALKAMNANRKELLSAVQ